MKRSNNQKRKQKHKTWNIVIALVIIVLFAWVGYLIGTYHRLLAQDDKMGHSSSFATSQTSNKQKNNTTNNTENSNTQTNDQEQSTVDEVRPISFPVNQQGIWYYYSSKNNQVESITIKDNKLLDNETGEVISQVYNAEDTTKDGQIPELAKAGVNKNGRFIITPWPGNAGESDIFWTKQNEQGENVLYTAPPQSDNIASFYQTSTIALSHKDDVLGVE